MSPKRGDRVAPPPGPDEWDVVFGTNDAAKGWEELCSQAANNTRQAWSVMRLDPSPVGDQAIAICGPSGSGKSTLAAWLTECGHLLVSDDLCRFEITTEGQARVYPSAPRLNLWRDALDALHRSDEGLERNHYKFDKYHINLTDFQTCRVVQGERGRPLPLRAIYLLAWGELGLVRLTGLTALRHLVESATYRGELLEPMNQVAAHWQRCAELAKRVPIFGFTRPRDWNGMEKSMELLRMHLREGLTLSRERGR